MVPSGQSRDLPTLVLSAVLIAAGCATDIEYPPGELRVILQFSRSVDPRDPKLLGQLEAYAGTSVRLSALVSDKEAAFWLKCKVRDPECREILGRLATVPVVVGLQPDRYRLPSDPTR